MRRLPWVLLLGALGCHLAPPPVVSTGPRGMPKPAPPAACGDRCPPRGGEIALGCDHVCHLDGDGRVLCWGNNEHGQLGRAGVPFASRPELVAEAQGALHIAAARDATCALMAEGHVVGWGREPAWSEVRARPAEVPDLAGTVALAMGREHLCALGGDGRVRCREMANGAVEVAGLSDTAAIGLAEGQLCALGRDRRARSVDLWRTRGPTLISGTRGRCT
jgi:hypothetical protein